MKMPPRLTVVGEQERPDHHYLPNDARCYFWGEYTPYEHTQGKRWNFSPTNKLISNFKKSLDRKDRPDWPYKQRAIEHVAYAFSKFLKWDTLHSELGVALFPLPPSKSPEDPMYDGRMHVMLQQLAQKVGLPLDIRDCLRFSGVHAASHAAAQRPSPDELYTELCFDPVISRPDKVPGLIFVFDDMLTTGAHYVAVSRKLNEIYPGVPIVGNFIARRLIPDPFDDLDVL